MLRTEWGPFLGGHLENCRANGGLESACLSLHPSAAFTLSAEKGQIGTLTLAQCPTPQVSGEREQ